MRETTTMMGCLVCESVEILMDDKVCVSAKLSADLFPLVVVADIVASFLFSVLSQSNGGPSSLSFVTRTAMVSTSFKCF